MAAVKIHLTGGSTANVNLSGKELEGFLERVDASNVPGTITIEDTPKLVIIVSHITMVEIT